MNRRNKAKGGAQSALKNPSLAKPATPAPAPPPPKPPSPPAPPPPVANPLPSTARKSSPGPSKPPPASPSTLLRAEWKAFQSWLAPRREERDKQLAEARAPPRPIRGAATFGRKPAVAQPLDATALAKLEHKLNTELCEASRAEWENRLAKKGLREDDWTDITQAEMRAVEDAFMPPEAVPQPSTSRESGRYGLAGNSLSGNATQLSSDSYPPSNGAPTWGANTAAKSAFSTAPSLKQEISWEAPVPPGNQVGQDATAQARRFGDISNQQNGRAAGSNSRQDFSNELQPPASSGQEESLWSSVMTGRKTPAPSASQTPPAPVKQVPEESPWEAVMRSKSTGMPSRMGAQAPPPPPPVESQESLWDSAPNGKSTAFFAMHTSGQPDSYRESPWEAAMKGSNKSTSSVARSTSNSSQESADSAWDSPFTTPASVARSMSASSTEQSWQDYNPIGRTRSGTINKPAVSSPLASFEPQVSEPSPNYRVISPTTIELEEGDYVQAGFEGLTENDLENSIREFYSNVAEAEIELRKQLWARGTMQTQRPALLEEFTQGMEENARAVWEGWKELREKEKERQRIAAEKEKEKLSHMKKPVWRNATSRAQTATPVPTPPPAPAPAPTPPTPAPAMKRQTKKGRRQMVEPEPEPPQAEPSAFAQPTQIPGSFQADGDESILGRLQASAGSAIRGLWTSDPSPRSASPVPPPAAAPSNRNPFGNPQASNNPWGAPKKPTGLSKVTVTDEEDEEDEEVQVKRVTQEKKAAEFLSQSTGSPFGWMNSGSSGPTGRSSTPKPEPLQTRPSARGGPPSPSFWDQPAPGPGRSRKLSSANATAPQRFWTPDNAKGNQDNGGDNDPAKAMMEAAMLQLQEDDDDGSDPLDSDEVMRAMSAYTQGAKMSGGSRTYAGGMDTRKRAISTSNKRWQPTVA